MNERVPIFVLASYVSALSMRVARLPFPGESLKGEEIVLEAGGKGLNVAIAAQRLGATVDGLIPVGDDALGRMADAAIADNGLLSTMLVRLPGQSGTGIGMIGPDGENMIAVFPGANALLAGDHVAGARARLEACGSVVAQFEIGDAPIAAAFALARAAGVRTLLNPSPYRPIPPAILGATDILVVNASEARALLIDLDPAASGDVSGIGGDTLARHLFGQGLAALVVTAGCQGAYVWRTDAPPLSRPAIPIDAQDCTGCGDAFLAGLAVSLNEGADWPAALRLASVCGAITASRIGVLDALPIRATADAWLAERLLEKTL